MVNRRHLLLLAGGSLVAAGGVTAQQAEQPSLPAVAVYPTDAGPAARGLGSARVDPQDISRRLEVALRASRRFRMFERNAELLGATVLREQTLATSGLAAGNAAEFGKLHNVQLVVVPYVTEFSLGSSFAEIEGFPGRYVRTDRGVLRLTVKVLDTTTGEIKYQIETTGETSRRGGPQSGRSGTPAPETWQQLVDQAAQTAAERVINAVFPILVIRTEGRQIFLNRGEGGGVRVGETRDLFKAGEALIDPSTGESLGAAETPLGRVRIIRVAPRFSVAEPVGTLTGQPQTGDVVR
jgi:curli biogenesis system outer membrane secretion channel CsgG